MAFLYWVVFSLTWQAVHSLLKREANQALPGVKNEFICKASPLPNSQKNFLMSICTQSLCDELDAPVRREQHAGCGTPDSNDCSSLSPGNAKVPWSCRDRVRLFLGTEQVAAACAYKLFSAFPPLHLPPSLCSPPRCCVSAAVHGHRLRSCLLPPPITYLSPGTNLRNLVGGKGQGYTHPSAASPAPQLCQRPCRDVSSNRLFWHDTQPCWLQPREAGKGRAIPFFIKRIYKHTVHKHFSFLHSDGWLYVYEMFSFIWRQSNQNQLKLWRWREGKQVGVGLTVPLAPWAVQG